VEIALEPKDFRPISLIHSFAKILTKVLANRLAMYIDRLISTSQSAFIKRRCIQENFMYVRGLARHYHRTKTPACLIKLDITKAFDSVSWEYLIELLAVRGFPTRWLNWLAVILRTSSSVILLNGCPGDSIKHRRGLRQGDPLSPYLFILAIDVLNSILTLQLSKASSLSSKAGSLGSAFLCMLMMLSSSATPKKKISLALWIL
jgi:mannosylglycoprotein endo-beta-mannosidase